MSLDAAPALKHLGRSLTFPVFSYRAALSPDRSRSLTVFELNKCGRYSGLTAEENIINGETRQLLSLTGG